MSHLYEVPAEFARRARVDARRYAADYARSVSDPDGFWGEIGRRIDWIRPYTQVRDVSFRFEDFRIRWYADGTLNVAANCLDRHLAKRGDQTAIRWEGDDAKDQRTITYRELHAEVCRFANALKGLGVTKGDRITIYLPMIPEAAVAMLACARLGAVHSIVFGGFSPESVASRVKDCGSKLIITADEGRRGGRTVPLKANVDAALSQHALPSVEKVVVVRRTGGKVAWHEHRDLHYEELVAGASPDCPPVEVSAEDPLFILYTSGSTGKPKGVLHTSRLSPLCVLLVRDGFRLA
jgi:acetyl-CoA synthetase